MLKKKVLAAAVASLGLAMPIAHADEAASPHSVTGTLTFTTNYHTRGVTQTNFKPAIQGSIDYGHASGFYASLWGSNVSWPGDFWQAPFDTAPIDPILGFSPYGSNSKISSSLELDFSAGYRNKFAGDFSYDVGAVYYYFPGQYNLDTSAATGAPGLVKPNTGEVYAGLGWKWITAKVWYAVTDGVFMVSDARGTTYANLSATVPIGQSGFTITGAVGTWMWAGQMDNFRNWGVKNDVLDLVDYKLVVTKDLFGFTWAATYWGSTADKTFTVPGNSPNGGAGGQLAAWGMRNGKNAGDDTLFLSVTKAF